MSEILSQICISLHVKYPLFLSDLNFINRSSKNTHKIPRKSVQLEPSCSMQKDGRLDRHDEANSYFRNSAKSSKNKSITLQKSHCISIKKPTC